MRTLVGLCRCGADGSMLAMKCALLALVSFVLLAGCKIGSSSNPAEGGSAGVLAAPGDTKAGGCCSEGAGSGACCSEGEAAAAAKPAAGACCSEAKPAAAAPKKADGPCCGACAPEVQPVAPVSPN